MLLFPIPILAIENEDDRVFIAEIYLRHRSMMYKVAHSVLGSDNELDDVISESCVHLINKLDTLRMLDEPALKRYITVTVRNTSINQIARSHHVQHLEAELGNRHPNNSAEIPSAEARILLREEINMVWAAISSLSEKEQTVLRLKIYQGLPDDEISGITGLAESSIRKYVTRARQHIKDQIYRREDDE